MALSASTIWEVETTGDDTNNGGAFDPSQTAGMFTDGAATVANTSAPVFTSASYNFAAGDVGAWVYISSGTNWTAGWYKIASVASNAATLTGTIGQGVLKTTLVPTTVVGCATTASPTGATWTIDYSQQAAARYAYTDLVSVGTGLTVSSAANPFAKEQVGNSIVVTGGTNFNTGRYVIASVASGTATVVGPTNITTGAGINGTGGQGGALASPGKSMAAIIANNVVMIKSGTYSITSTSANVAGGVLSIATSYKFEGYGAVRGDLSTAPIWQASGIASVAIWTDTNFSSTLRNITIDGASLTSIRGFSIGSQGIYHKLTAINCTNNGFQTGTGNSVLTFCKASGCSTQPAINAIVALFACEIYNNTGGTFSGNIQYAVACLFYGNSGGTTDGFISTGSGPTMFLNCIAYNNGRDGFRAGSNQQMFVNCIAEANTGLGFNDAAKVNTTFFNCAVYNNTGGPTSVTGSRSNIYGTVTGTSSFFTNAASGDFSLNNTATGGGLCRAAGFPGTFPAGTSVGYLDIGAVQHKGGGGPFGMMGVM